MRKTLSSRRDDKQYVLDVLGDYTGILEHIDPDRFHEVQEALAGSMEDLAAFVAEHL